MNRAAHHTRRTVSAIACAGALAVTVACGIADEEPAPATAPGASDAQGDSLEELESGLVKAQARVTTYPEVTEVAGVEALKGKTVWWVPYGTAVPAFGVIGSGLEDSLSAAGISMHTCDGKFLPTAVAGCLSQAVSHGADAVITGYVDYNLIPAAFDSLVKAGVPVLIGGAANNSDKAESAAFSFFDASELLNQAQKLAMESVIVDSGGKANVLYVGIGDSAQTKASGDFAESVLADECAGCTLDRIEYSTSNINKLPSQVSAALISNPDTDYVVAYADVAAPLIIEGIRAAGRTEKTKVVASGGALDSLQRIRAGDTPQTVDIGVSLVYLGWQFGDGIIRMLTGNAPTPGPGVLRVFNADNVADLELTPESNLSLSWYGNDDYKTAFTSAWGVS